LKAWLNDQPREVAVALAVRSALRALPSLWAARAVSNADFFADIVLPVFRAIAVAWSAAKYPDHATRLQAAADAAAALAYRLRPQIDTPAADAAAASYYSVGASYHAASYRSDAAAESAGDAADAAFAALEATPGTAIPSTAMSGFAMPGAAMSGFAGGVASASAVFWSAVSADALRVEKGATPAAVAASPLWPHGQSNELQSFLKQISVVLIVDDRNWIVWLDWYEARLAGGQSNEKLEIARATIPNEIWDQGPAVVNAEIKRLIEELEPPLQVMDLSARATGTAGTLQSSQISLSASANAVAGEIVAVVSNFELPPAEAIPQQVPTATNFRTNAEGLIDIVPDPPASQTVADLQQQELYEETRYKADQLVRLGDNHLGELKTPAQLFRDALKERIEDLSITIAWSCGNRLRTLLDAHKTSLAIAEPDPGRLPPFVAGALRDLVETWNAFLSAMREGANLMQSVLGLKNSRRRKSLFPWPRHSSTR
jgi:hypothetical protein